MTAIEHNDSIVFIHNAEKGAAVKSYGIEVAKLSGIPKIVIKMANKYLLYLENKNKHEIDLFSINDSSYFNYADDKNSEISKHENEVLLKIKSLDLEALSAKEALNILYDLRNKLNY